MSIDAITKLNDRERRCLRLVADGLNTKQIARAIGVSDTRAAKIIDSANRKLGVSSRLDAARLLAQHENRGVNIIPGMSHPLPGASNFPAPGTPDEQARQPHMLREERSAFHAASDPMQLGLPRRRGGKSNDLTTWQRMVWIAILSSVALVGVGVLARGLSSLSDQIIMVPPDPGR